MTPTNPYEAEARKALDSVLKMELGPDRLEILADAERLADKATAWHEGFMFAMNLVVEKTKQVA